MGALFRTVAMLCIILYCSVTNATEQRNNAALSQEGISDGHVVQVTDPSSTGTDFVIGGTLISGVSVLDSTRWGSPCSVNVGVYTNPNYDVPASNVNVTVLTRKQGTDNYYGYSTVKTDSNGTACALTLCNQEAVIIVTSGIERLFADEKHVLPPAYQATAQSGNEEVVFPVMRWGDIMGKSGPVYLYTTNHTECRAAGSSNYHFRFSFLSVPDNLTIIEPEQHKYLSWYKTSSLSTTFKVCYIKIKMSVDSYSAAVVADSYTEDKQKLYGTFRGGPKADPNAVNSNVRAACAEFRCPVYDDDSDEPDTTVVNVTLVPPSGVTCLKTSGASGLDDIAYTSTGFSASFTAGDNKGPKFGIYTAYTRYVARTLCNSGSNVFASDFRMHPDRHYAVGYSCQPTA